MSSKNSGTNTLECEVTEIHKTGFWIFIHNKEYFISFKDFPMFQDKSVDKIFDVKFFEPDHLYWEKLDIDIELGSIHNPGNYPLMYR